MTMQHSSKIQYIQFWSSKIQSLHCRVSEGTGCLVIVLGHFEKILMRYKRIDSDLSTQR